MPVENELYNALMRAAHSLVQRGPPRLRDPRTPAPTQSRGVRRRAVVRRLWQRARAAMS